MLGASVVRGSARAGLRTLLAPVRRRFERDVADPASAQLRVLRRILRGAAATDYGRSLGIGGGESYEEFARRVPVVGYEELAPWVERQAAEAGPVLAPDPVVVFEETSGSSGPRKLVPYTRPLLAAFDAMIRLWLHDLLVHGPALRTGRTFLSVSPPVRVPRRAASGVPVGFDDDTLYLSRGLRRLLGGRFLMPAGLEGVSSHETWRRVLAARLVAEADLEIVSVWSPTYLTAILDWISGHRERVASDLRRGRVDVEGRAIPLPDRPEARRILEDGDPPAWRRLWPRLALLSCWADAASGPYAERLGALFPGVRLQPKGLLATEAALTVPILRAPAPVPLIGHVFLEFRAESGEILRVHELEEDGEYEVLLTQAAGLLRYRLGDQVRCEGRYGATPCLRFVGRTDDVSDLVGEKLQERFVRAAAERATGGAGAFGFLVPVAGGPGAPHYLWITETADPASELGPALEAELREAMQYDAARHLGQLGRVRVLERTDARERYTRLFLGRGLKWGDIKPRALVPTPSEPELEALLW